MSVCRLAREAFGVTALYYTFSPASRGVRKNSLIQISAYVQEKLHDIMVAFVCGSRQCRAASATAIDIRIGTIIYKNLNNVHSA